MEKQTSAWKGILAGMAGGLAAAWVINVAHTAGDGKKQGGPPVRYAFGVLSGGLYGGLAEYSTAVTSGFGTTYGSVVSSASPFAGHLVYGATTELVRRMVRRLL